MITKKVTYKDFNGNERTQTCCFHIMKSEAMSMEFKCGGNLVAILQRIIDEKDTKKLGQLFEDLILKTYGIKSDDGISFTKSPEISAAFKCTPAYDQIYMELLTDADAAAKFINGVVPKDVAEKMAEIEKQEQKAKQPEEAPQLNIGATTAPVSNVVTPSFPEQH